MPGTDDSKKYGNRLDDIVEEYGSLKKAKEATDSEGDKISSNIKNKSYVKEVKVYTNGKIMNIIVEVKSSTSKKTAKELKSVVLNSLDKTIKKLYDIQLFIKNENEKAKDFPIIGYKNSSDKDFVF